MNTEYADWLEDKVLAQIYGTDDLDGRYTAYEELFSDMYREDE